MRVARVFGYVSTTALFAAFAAIATLQIGAPDSSDSSGPLGPQDVPHALNAADSKGGSHASASTSRAPRVTTARDGRAAAALQKQFPGQASQVLDASGVLAAAGDPSDPNAPEGYYRILGAGRDDGEPEAPALARMPARGSDPVRFTGHHGFTIDVRETGARGVAEPAGRGVAYERDGGYAFWTATDAGYEEWLLVTGGRTDEIASWVLPQGTLRQVGDAVEVLDDRGESQMKITAPHAFRAGGVRVAAHVRVDHNRIVVGVDMPGERFEEPLLVDPLWQVTADAPNGRSIHTAARLADGRVLHVGGFDDVGQLTGSAAIFNPTTEVWQSAAPLFDVVYAAASVRLLDGRVLVTNGNGGVTPGGTLGALYNPVSNTWTTADPARTALGSPATRLGLKSVLLPDGKVLLTGNFCCPGTEAQIYDPALDKFFPVQNMVFHRLQHTLTLLADGTVLAAGGGTTNASALNSNKAEIFIPDTSGPQPNYLNGHWQQVGNMSAGHADGFAARLTVGPNAGKVMVCGGFDGATFPGNYFFTNTCDLYNPATQSFTPTGSMNGIRQLSGTGNGGSVAAVIEAGPLVGNVLAAGGYPALIGSEIYDATTGVWQSLCPMLNGRLRHTTTALTDGRVLVAGGSAVPGSQSLKQTEILNPNTSVLDVNCNGIPDAVDPCPAGSCVTVAGTVAADTTTNCVVDPSEVGVAGRMVRADSGTGQHYYAVTNAFGAYRLTLPIGVQFSVSLVPNTYTVESPACTPPTVYTPSPFVSSGGNNFSLLATCNGVVTVIALPPPDPNSCPNLLPPHYASPCPTHPWRYCAVVTNTGSLPFATSTTAALFLDPAMSYVAIDPVNTTCPGTLIFGGGTTVMWDVTSLGAGSQCQVCADVSVIGPGAPCWTTTGALLPSCDPNLFIIGMKQECSQCSCDPNDKSVSPEGCGAEHLTPPTDLTYTVRFHNIGAGPAHNVIIRDEIDPNLDVESLRVLASSHPVSDIRVEPLQGLVVSFEGIELPADRDDSPGSQGYVVFQLSPKAGIQAGTSLANTADVYFDNNPPVTTNTVVNKMNPAGTGAPTCVTLQRGVSGSVEDAHIASDKPTKNWGSSQSLAIGNVAPGQRQALVRWDLSAIPSCATIASATATFDVLLGSPSALSLHLVAVPWSEASITHQSFAGRYFRDVSATLPAAASPSADITSLVQAWVNGTSPNHGVLIDRDPTTSTVLHSSEAADVTKRPRLEVCYYPAP